MNQREQIEFYQKRSLEQAERMAWIQRLYEEYRGYKKTLDADVQEYVKRIVEDSNYDDDEECPASDTYEYKICREAYKKYTDNNKELVFEELLSSLDDYCTGWVQKQLRIVGRYSYQSEAAILENAHIAVWNSILKDIKNDIVKDYFPKYAFGIYKICAKSFLRIEKKISTKEVPLDAPVDDGGDDGRSYADLFTGNKGADNEYENAEKRELYDKLFRVYCRGFMETNAFPPRPLALYYARVLPHLLNDISEKKAASAKWAYKRMESKLVSELSEDSERSIKVLIDEKLKWCDDFMQQLDELTTVGTKQVYLRDLVYTNAYKENKIEDWADSMHKTAVKTAMGIMTEEEDLLTLARTYISEEDVLYRMIKGGKRK